MNPSISNSRTSNSIKNIIASVITKIFSLIIVILSRKIFLEYLSVELLGLGTTFSSFLLFLTISEMGISTAITFKLYGPLKDRNYLKISTLVNIMRKAYKYIVIFIIIGGILLVPAIPLVIRDSHEIKDIYIIYFLYLFYTAFQYLFSYNKVLLIADQKQYITSLISFVCYVTYHLLQIIILILSGNYILFLFIQTIFMLIENVWIKIIVNKSYKHINLRKLEKLSIEEKRDLKKSIISLGIKKVSGVTTVAIDNLVITVFISTIATGLYSNMSIIITSVNAILFLMFSSITASIGNFVVSKNQEESLKMFKNIQFLNFWLYSFSTIFIYFMINPLLEMWLGLDYTMSNSIIFISVINFFIVGIKTPIDSYLSAYGLFWKQRYQPIITTLVNVILSIILIQLFGIVGTLISTTITYLFIYIPMELYILYKYGFNRKVYSYLLKLALFMILTCGFIFIFKLIFNEISLNIKNLMFISFIILITVNSIYLLIFHKTREFNFFYNKVKEFFHSIIKANN